MCRPSHSMRFCPINTNISASVQLGPLPLWAAVGCVWDGADEVLPAPQRPPPLPVAATGETGVLLSRSTVPKSQSAVVGSCVDGQWEVSKSTMSSIVSWSTFSMQTENEKSQKPSKQLRRQGEETNIPPARRLKSEKTRTEPAAHEITVSTGDSDECYVHRGSHKHSAVVNRPKKPMDSPLLPQPSVVRGSQEPDAEVVVPDSPEEANDAERPDDCILQPKKQNSDNALPCTRLLYLLRGWSFIPCRVWIARARQKNPSHQQKYLQAAADSWRVFRPRTQTKT